MGIKQLQQQYKDGKITKAQYLAKLKELLDGETIDQAEYDEAKDFDPEEEKPIYTQADVDSFIAKKASQQLKKICRDAGIDIDGVANKDLVSHVTNVLKNGAGKPGDKNNQPSSEELTKLQKAAGKVEGLSKRVKDLSIENAILKNLGGDFKAVNPLQVVRSIMYDYKDLIEIDEDGDEIKIDRKQVTRALSRVKEAEPNLFEAGEGDDEGANGGGKQQNQGHNFQSKGPGGTNKPLNAKDKEYERLKAEGLAAMGVKASETK